MRFALAGIAWLGVSVAAGAAPAEPPAGAACAVRAGEKAHLRFVELCGTGFFISATPLPCSTEERASATCEPVTALEVSPLTGPGKNRPVAALVTEAATAQRLCAERFGGRLPTPAEREQARRSLGLVSLEVREEPGEFARLRMDERPEWVAEGGRVTRSPAEVARPRKPGEVLLRCVAEPALPVATAVPIGAVCDERPQEAGVRSPDCALSVPGTAGRFELGCDPSDPVRSRAGPEQAAVRCMLPERALTAVPKRP